MNDINNEGTVTAFVGLKRDLENKREVHQQQVVELAEAKKIDDPLFFEASSVDPQGDNNTLLCTQ